MIFSTSIRSWFERPIRWVKANPLLTVLLSILCSLLVVLFLAFVAVIFFKTVEVCVGRLLGSSDLDLFRKKEILTFLGIGMGGILLALQAVIANRRTKALEDTAKAQADTARAQAKATEEQAKANQNTERGQRQERLKNAIEHMGHASDLVRLGGAYELFHLAQDTKDLCQTVLDILCAHIRRTTGKSEYREAYKSKPSEEIQSLLTLLFVQKHEVFKGCHINLQGSWLNGGNLTRARLQAANLVEANMQDAELREACLQGTRLERTHLQGAELREAHMQSADLREAKLQGANLMQVHLQAANLFGAKLMKADLRRANLQGAYVVLGQLQQARLVEAYLQAADLRLARLQGADLTNARVQAAEFCHTGLQEATLEGTHLQGVKHRGGDDWTLAPFAESIRESIGKNSDLFGAIFAGKLDERRLKVIVKDLPDPQAKELRVKLEPHIGMPENNELPENSRAITGAYTEEEAEQWIAEYEEGMLEVLDEAGDSELADM